MEAAWRGDLAQATTLLDAGADHNAVDGQSWTAAHYAAMDGHLEIVRLLRGRGADLDKRDSEGWTPYLGESYNYRAGTFTRPRRT